MTDTLFNTAENQTNVEGNQGNQSKYTNWSIEDLVKKAEAADVHINKLEAEHADYRKSEATLQEVLRKLDQNTNTNQNNDPSNVVNQRQEPSNSSEGLKMEDVDKLVSASFERKQKETLARQNVELIRSELQKVWGDNYKVRLAERAQELDVEQNYLESMSEDHPKAFLRLVLGESKTTSNPNQHTAPSSSTNPPVSSNPGQMTKFREFREAEKANPNLRHDPDFQNQKLIAAAQHGDSFYK